MKNIRAFSFILALLLAFSLLFTYSQPAYAATVKTNVVSQIKYKAGNSYCTQKFTYNDKGLLTQKSLVMPDGSVRIKVKYTYNSNNLVKSSTVYELGSKAVTTSYTYNSKKQLKKRVTKAVHSDIEISNKYTYNDDGTLYKAVQTYSGDSYMDDGTKVTSRYTFNSKGLLTKKKTTNSTDSEQNGTDSYRYDSKGNMTADVYQNAHFTSTTTRKLTYKDGLLKKYTESNSMSGSSTTYNLTWKSVSTTKAISKIVQKQQYEIINNYGTDLYLGYDFI